VTGTASLEEGCGGLDRYSIQ